MIDGFTSRDLTALPAALLPLAKAHGRIDFPDDDELLKSFIARTIEQFERDTSHMLFEADFWCEPEEADFRNGEMRFECSPVSTVVVENPVGTALTDQTVYTLKGRGLTGTRLYSLAGSFAAGMRVTFHTGYAPALLPPGILGVVLQTTQHLYEHREIYRPSNVEIDPYWFNQVVAGYRIPTA